MNLIASRLSSFGSLTLVIIGHYIVFAHLIGGFLLILGLLTRFACLIQLPVVLGAVIFINSSWDMMRPFSELSLSILVLVGLIYFLIVGNGPWSFNKFMDEEKAAI